jgi:Fur family transcriptional regulator, iron response regulator
MRHPSVGFGQAPVQSDKSSLAHHYGMTRTTKEKLRSVGIRPTRTRIALAHILFAHGNRHVSAEMLFEEANRTKVSVSLATVYNALRDFTEVGLLRQLAVESSKSYFDTNSSDHHHFYLEDRQELMDIPPTDVMVGQAPAPPEGFEITRIDVVVRLRQKTKRHGE